MCLQVVDSTPASDLHLLADYLMLFPYYTGWRIHSVCMLALD
jgi:hypothetical protein